MCVSLIIYKLQIYVKQYLTSNKIKKYDNKEMYYKLKLS